MSKRNYYRGHQETKRVSLNARFARMGKSQKSQNSMRVNLLSYQAERERYNRNQVSLQRQKATQSRREPVRGHSTYLLGLDGRQARPESHRTRRGTGTTIITSTGRSLTLHSRRAAISGNVSSTSANIAAIRGSYTGRSNVSLGIRSRQAMQYPIREQPMNVFRGGQHLQPSINSTLLMVNQISAAARSATRSRMAATATRGTARSSRFPKANVRAARAKRSISGSKHSSRSLHKTNRKSSTVRSSSARFSQKSLDDELDAYQKQRSVNITLEVKNSKEEEEEASTFTEELETKVTEITEVTEMDEIAVVREMKTKKVEESEEPYDINILDIQDIYGIGVLEDEY